MWIQEVQNNRDPDQNSATPPPPFQQTGSVRTQPTQAYEGSLARQRSNPSNCGRSKRNKHIHCCTARNRPPLAEIYIGMALKKPSENSDSEVVLTKPSRELGSGSERRGSSRSGWRAPAPASRSLWSGSRWPSARWTCRRCRVCRLGGKPSKTPGKPGWLEGKARGTCHLHTCKDLKIKG